MAPSSLPEQAAAPQAPRLAQRTQLGPWGHGISDEAECEGYDNATCDFQLGPARARVVEYAARRHVDATGHVVRRYRMMSQAIFLGDDEPAR